MKARIGTQWFKVIGEKMIHGNKHLEIEHRDDGNNKVIGFVPWWLVEEIV